MIEQDQINLIEREGKHTYEVHVNGESTTLPSVTTIVNFVMNKPALTPWAYGVGIKSTLKYLEETVIYDSQHEVFAWPSVGEIKLALVEREATHDDEMRRGGERGIQIHDILAAIVNDEEYSYSTDIKPYVESLLGFIEAYGIEFELSEQMVVSLEDGFAGTFDAIGIVRKHPKRRRHPDLTGKRVLLDIKTNSEGRTYPETHLPQIEAYNKAWEEMGGEPVDARFVVGIGPAENGKPKFGPCVSYARYDMFKRILDLYNEILWTKANNPNKRS